MSEEKGVHKTFARSCERELGEQALAAALPRRKNRLPWRWRRAPLVSVHET